MLAIALFATVSASGLKFMDCLGRQGGCDYWDHTGTWNVVSTRQPLTTHCDRWTYIVTPRSNERMQYSEFCMNRKDFESIICSKVPRGKHNQFMSFVLEVQRNGTPLQAGILKQWKIGKVVVAAVVEHSVLYDESITKPVRSLWFKQSALLSKDEKSIILTSWTYFLQWF